MHRFKERSIKVYSSMCRSVRWERNEEQRSRRPRARHSLICPESVITPYKACQFSTIGSSLTIAVFVGEFQGLGVRGRQQTGTGGFSALSFRTVDSMANFAAHGHSAAMEQQQLLYNLRSPTLPLSDKLQLVETAFAELDKTPSLAQLVRDWTIDLFLRSRQNSDVILSLPWWHVLARATAAAPSTSSSPSLPVWTSFVTAYAASEEPNTELVTVVNAAWTRLATPAMRKATIDNPLAATATLLTASCEIVKRQSKDSIAWQNLMFTWLKAFRSVLDLSKTGKKV